MARVDGCTVSITRQHGPCWRVMETGHPSTRAVNSASGNRALVLVLRFTASEWITSNDCSGRGVPFVELVRHSLCLQWRLFASGAGYQHWRQIAMLEVVHTVTYEGGAVRCFYILHGLSLRNRDRRRTKTGTNHNPDPNRYRIRCPDPIARI